MSELVLSSYVKIMQEGFLENNKQEAAVRLLLDSIMCQEEANCMTDLTSKKISNIVNRKDSVPDDIYLASSKESVIKGVHSYFSNRIMKELNPHLKFDVLEKIAQLVQNDSDIATMKKTELLSYFKNESYALFLAEAFLYAVSRNNKAAKEMEKKSQKRLLYKSSLIPEEEGRTLLNGSKVKTLSKTEDIKRNEAYLLETDFTFNTRYGDEGRRVVDACAAIDGLSIYGETSSENWMSRSYLNNATKANNVFCTAVFKILEVAGNECKVQYLTIGDDISC